MQLTRIDFVGQNGNDGQVYDTVAIDGVVYRKNQNCIYALYLHVKTGSWRVSALVKNEDLNDKFAPKHQKTSAITKRLAVVSVEAEFTRNRGKVD